MLNLKETLKRGVLVYLAARGKLSSLETYAKIAKEQEERCKRLFSVIVDQNHKINYWFNLWFGMSREFQAAQNMLCDKIDELRKRLGEYETPYLDELVQQSVKDKWVEPKGPHPLPYVKHEPGIAVEAPPVSVNPETV